MNQHMDLNQHPLEPQSLQHIYTPDHDLTYLVTDHNNLTLTTPGINHSSSQLHRMTAIDNMPKPSEPTSRMHLALQTSSIIHPTGENPMITELLPHSTTIIPEQVKTSSERLDEILDIVCKNEGVVKEPISLAKTQANQLPQPPAKSTIIPSNKVNSKYFCTLCTKIFSAERYYKQHYNSVHLHSGPKRYKCMLCQRSFHTEKALQKHIDHEVYKPHNCDECERTFNRKPDLIRHSFVHRKSKPFICTACHKSFIRSDQLTSHHKNCTLSIDSKTSTSINTTATTPITSTTTLTNLAADSSNEATTLSSL